MPTQHEKYLRDFGVNSEECSKLEKTLQYALDTRKFEIELYWKRAGYFWTLIAATFAGYFVVLGSKDLPEKDLFAFVLACTGFLFTFAWFQVNRGSKQWQENWENHVYMLEDAVIGPLFKTTLGRAPSQDLWGKLITGPGNISVSRTNQFVSLFTLCIWIGLGCLCLNPLDIEYPVSGKHVIVTSVTLLFCFLIVRHGSTYSGNHEHVLTQRTTKIIG